MIQRPAGIGIFQFVTLAALRAGQLARGCRPKIDGVHKITVIAQLEVSAGKVAQAFAATDTRSEPARVDSGVADVLAPIATI